MKTAKPYAGFMAQFPRARREVAVLKRRYPHACKWATLRAALAAATTPQPDNQPPKD